MITQPHSSHNICILDKNLHSMLYEKLSEYTNNNYGILCAIDYNEWLTTSKMLNKKGIDVSRYIENGRLVLTPRQEIYSKSRIVRKDIIQGWMEIISKVEKRYNYDRILIIGSNQVFFDTNAIDGLIDCERNGGLQLECNGIEVICTCELVGLSLLSLSQLISLLSMHAFSVHCSHRYEDLHRYQIINLIRYGLDNSVGKGTSDLILRTLELVYNITQKKIINDPFTFEQTLSRILGNNKEKIIQNIATFMKRQLLYEEGIKAKKKVDYR